MRAHSKKVHRLYVAAPLGRVMTLVAKYEDSFTVYSAQGYFRGKKESMVVVEIATNDGKTVINIGRILRERFKQDGVGHVVDGKYSRITN